MSRFLLSGLAGLCMSVSAHATNVFGEDNRMAMDSTAYPWSAVGKLRRDDASGLSWSCSATLVGKDLVLTAAHCIYEDKTGALKPGTTYFYANYQGGKSLGVSEATVIAEGTKTPSSDRGKDWAILRLKKPLGEDPGIGFLGCEPVDFVLTAQQTTPVIHVGYSGDYRGGNTAGVHWGCLIRAWVQGGSLESDCDWTAGASGGPIFRTVQNPDETYDPDQTRIVAISVASRNQPDHKPWMGLEYEWKKANIAASATEFCARILELRDKPPSEQ